MAFTETGIAHASAGAGHAVDAGSGRSEPAGLLGDAVCGAPVRIWPDRAFDAAAPEAHPDCAAITGPR